MNRDLSGSLTENPKFVGFTSEAMIGAKFRIVLSVWVLGAVLVGLSSCETEVELNAPYKETTIVYGLLDQNDTIHFFKINKSFLGTGNALDYAAIRDSSEYELSQLDARVEEYVNGVISRQWVLQDTEITNKEDGVFYGPEQTVYYFSEPNLNENATYRFVCDIQVNEDSTKTVEGETELVRDFSVSNPLANWPPPNPSSKVSFASQLGSYQTFTCRWATSEHGFRYDLTIRFYYLEVTPTDSTMRKLDWNLGIKKADPATVTELEKAIEGETFYEWVYNTITNSSTLNDPDVIQRKFKGLDFIISVAGEELNTYMELNEPVTGIVQQRPEYTNLSGGIGIFSSRYKKAVDNKWLSKNSLQELSEGSITGSLLFCSDTINHQFESFYCP